MANVRLLDREIRFGGGAASACRYVAVYRIGTYTVRVRVRVDIYARQSFAVAEVLAADLTWTALIDGEPPEPCSALPAAVGRVETVARQLIDRACTILLDVDGGDA